MESEAKTDPVVAQAQAVRAVSLHQGIQQLIANREADILDAMVLTYRSSSATFEYLLSKIAAISELRAIEDTLDRAARQGIEKATVSTSGSFSQ